MKGQSVVNCPLCGSNKVKSGEGLAKGYLITGILFCITLIGIPVGIFFLFAAIGAKRKKIKLRFRCLDCKHTFNVSENRLEEYNVALKSNEEAL